MINHGYVKINRKILSWEWYNDLVTFKLFIHLILTANIADTKWRGKNIPRGSLLTTISKLSAETNLSVKQVRTALEHLKRTNEVAIETSPQSTVITINNYDCYQQGANETANKGQTKGKQGANEGQTYYIEEDIRRIKKNKNIYYSAPQKKQKKSAEKNSEPSFDLEAIKKHAIENTPKI